MFVSLGSSCCIAYNLQSFGLLTKLPFDWITINLEDICKLLDNNFENFINKDYLIFGSKSNSHYLRENNSFIKNNTIFVNHAIYKSIGFYHDFTSIDNFEQIKEKYEYKINKLYKILKNNDLINFIHYGSPNLETIANFHLIVQKFTVKYNLIIISKKNYEEYKDYPKTKFIFDENKVATNWKRKYLYNLIYSCSFANILLQPIFIKSPKEYFKNKGIFSMKDLQNLIKKPLIYVPKIYEILNKIATSVGELENKIINSITVNVGENYSLFFDLKKTTIFEELLFKFWINNFINEDFQNANLVAYRLNNKIIESKNKHIINIVNIDSKIIFQRHYNSFAQHNIFIAKYLHKIVYHAMNSIDYDRLLCLGGECSLYYLFGNKAKYILCASDKSNITNDGVKNVKNAPTSTDILLDFSVSDYDKIDLKKFDLIVCNVGKLPIEHTIILTEKLIQTDANMIIRIACNYEQKEKEKEYYRLKYNIFQECILENFPLAPYNYVYLIIYKKIDKISE
jgi:hypothetical protein